MTNTKAELEKEAQRLSDEFSKLDNEAKQLNVECEAIDKLCEEYDTRRTITRLLKLTENEYTSEDFKCAQKLLSFFRRHRRYWEDSHIFETRHRKYQAALAVNDLKREHLEKEGKERRKK